MTVKLDKSAVSVVVYCTDCPWWSAFAWTLEEGHETAVRHETRVHPGAVQAQKAAGAARAIGHAVRYARS